MVASGTEVEGLRVVQQNRDCTEKLGQSRSSIYSQVQLQQKLIIIIISGWGGEQTPQPPFLPLPDRNGNFLQLSFIVQGGSSWHYTHANSRKIALLKYQNNHFSIKLPKQSSLLGVHKQFMNQFNNCSLVTLVLW